MIVRSALALIALVCLTADASAQCSPVPVRQRVRGLVERVRPFQRLRTVVTAAPLLAQPRLLAPVDGCGPAGCSIPATAAKK